MGNKISPIERTQYLGFSLRKLRGVLVSMLTKSQKIKLVEELADILKSNPSVLFVDFAGVNMGELIALKKILKRKICAGRP